MIDWLVTPLSGSTEHHIATWLSWHARCMVLSWGVVFPVGALVARYFKVLPSQDWPRVLDRKAWWRLHLALQWSGALIMALGLWLVLSYGKGAGSGELHVTLGWAVALAGFLQIASGLARGSKGGPTECNPRGDHYDMTIRRRWFEYLHKTLGWLALFCAVLVMARGLVLADAPRWMPLALIAWWTGLGVAAWHWQRRGRCIDTYQAIWGPTTDHPGNTMKPIGWGVQRPQVSNDHLAQ